MSFPATTLHEVLSQAQRRGTLGNRPIDEVLAHARHFVAALPASPCRVLDLGTGAGVPGLVVATDRPDSTVVLLDRRENRMDALRRAVSALGLSDRVSVVCAEASDAARREDLARSCDVVVARGFAPPTETARFAAPFLVEGGSLVVSEPPEGGSERWTADFLEPLGFGHVERLDGVVRLTFLGR